MNEILNSILEAERGGLTDLGKALRSLLEEGGGGGLPIYDTAQPLDPLLTAISSLDASEGVIYQSGEATVTKKQIGTSPGTVAAGDHDHTGTYVRVAAAPTAGNFPVLNSSGEIANSAYGPASFAVASHTHTQLHDPVTLAGSVNYLALSGQQITPSLINLGSHVTGNLPAGNLGSGTGANASTFLRGDMTWVTPPTNDPGMPEATLAQVRAGAASVGLSPVNLFAAYTPVALTDAATVAVDMSAGLVFDLTLGGNRTMGQPTNAKAGQAGEFWIYQDGTGGHSLAWHADYNFAGDAPTIPTDPGARCIVAFRVVGAGNIRCSTSLAAATGTEVTLAGSYDYLTITDQTITLHQVDASTDITGNLPVTSLGSGTGASVSTYLRGDMSWAEPPGGGAGITMEDAQDAVGTILADTSSINLTYTDATPEIKAEAIFGTGAGTVAEGNHNHNAAYISIVSSPTAGNFPILDSGGELSNSIYSSSTFATAAQGTLADSSVQPGDNISGLTNDAGFITSSHNHDASYISVVATPTTGNFPVLTAGGELNNSAYSNASFATAAQGTLANTAVQPGSLGTIASQNSSSVSITGGSITGITDLAIADGGTGASTAAAAFSALKQAASDTATGVVELATDAEVATGTDTTRAVTPAGAASRYQPLDGELTAIAGLTSATNALPYFTGAGTATVTTLSGYGRTLIDDADAATAQSTLGLGSMALQAASAVAITGGSITGITDLAIADGGTGAGTALAAFNNLKQAASSTYAGVVEIATSAETTAGLVIGADDTRIHDAVTLAGTPDYITLSGQQITRGLVDLTTDITGNLPVAHLGSGTGADNTTYLRGDMTWVTPAGGGGITLEEAQDGIGTILVDSSSIDFTYNDATPSITASAIFGTSSGTVAEGNHNHNATYQPLDATLTAWAAITGAADTLAYFSGADTVATTILTAFGRSLINDADAATAQGTLGLGSMATQASSSVSITGGSITGITDLAIADGGTGASSAAAAFTALKQAASDTATGVVELATDAEVATGTDTTRAVTPAGAASRYQPLDSELTALAGLTSAANALPYFSGSGTATVTTLSAYARTLIDDADDTTARGTLGLGSMAVKNAIVLTTDVTGNLPATNLGSGTGASSSTFLRGDMTWQTPSGSGLAEATATQVRDGTAAVSISPASLYDGMAPVTLTDAATVAVDLDTGIVFKLTLGGSRTMGQPTNQTVGKSGEFWIYQSGANNFTLAWHADYKFAGGAPVIPTGSGAYCVVAYRVMAANTIECSSSVSHAAVTVSGSPNYITLSGQDIVRALIDLTSHVTGLLPLANLASLTTVTETGPSRTNTAADRNNFVRWTSGSAKTCTISSAGGGVDGMMLQGINANAAGTLTFAGSGVTINGSLNFGAWKVYQLRFTSSTTADLIGGS